MCKNDTIKTKRSSSSSTTVNGTVGSISTMTLNNDDRNDSTSQHQRGLSPLSISSSGSSTSSTSSSNDDDDVGDRRNVAASDDNECNIDLIPLQHDRFDSNKNEGKERTGSSDNVQHGGLLRLRYRLRNSISTIATTTNNDITINTSELSSSPHSTSTKHTNSIQHSRTIYEKFMEQIPSYVCAIVTAMIMTWFSLVLPFTLAPDAAIRTYVLAQWEYDTSLSSFDNTIYTYGTDYFLAFCMMLIIIHIPSNRNSIFDGTAYYTNGLLGSYMISVVAGGIAHQFFTSIEIQNTIYFRMVWIICVGAVAIASAFMGSAASSLLQVHYSTLISMNSNNYNNKNNTNNKSKQQKSWINSMTVPIIPVSFWIVYAICVTLVVMMGRFSFQRPACDIFVVGITQFPSTCYMMLVLYCFGNTNNHHNTINKETLTRTTIITKPSQQQQQQQQNSLQVVLCNRMRFISCCGFILNAPLLPMYPILVQYTNFTLGTINTLLHTWLLIAWSCQGLSIRHIGLLLVQSEQQQKQQLCSKKNSNSTQINSNSKNHSKIISVD
jgi:hypothetical protein